MKRGRATIGIRVVALAALLACVRLAAAAPQKSVDDNPPAHAQLIERALDALSALQLEEAEALLAQLPEEAASEPAALYAHAELSYNRGHYEDAVAQMKSAMARASAKQQKRWREIESSMQASLTLSRTLTKLASPDGRYVVLYPSGKDEVLAELALEILRAADRELSSIFGVSLPAPIRLEIYPSPEALSEVSALTVEQIHTTGTVALSKWNRLMITSPKALVRGYPWADTITHELVHLVLSRLSGERAPVWLQEGTAKLFERKWRGGDAQLMLDPGSLALLHDAKAKGTLLTFDEMHPSIAMLPSEDQAILAFAEVATFMESYIARHGHAALRKGLIAIDEGADARAALAAAAQTSFSALESTWRSALPAGKLTPARTLKRRFRVGSGPADESADVEESEARKHMRVGDLLWDRGRAKAAAVEYGKAHEAAPFDPIVAARFGRAALSAGNPNGAVAALEPQTLLYPGHAPTHAVLGAAYLEVGRRAEAARALREAIWINPFDPDPQCGLARAVDDRVESERARRACALLRGE